MYQFFSIHSSVDGHFGWFHVLAIVNSATVNVGVKVFQILVFTVYTPRCGTMECYSAVKKKKRNNASWSNMGRPRGDHTKWSKSERKEKYHMMWLKGGNQTLIQRNQFTKHTRPHRLRKQTYGYQSGKVVERGKWGIACLACSP